MKLVLALKHGGELIAGAIGSDLESLGTGAAVNGGYENAALGSLRAPHRSKAAGNALKVTRLALSTATS